MIETINASEIKIAFVIFPYGAVAELIALQPIYLLVVGNFSVAVDTGKSLVAADPYMTQAVLFNGMDRIIRQSFGGSQFLEHGIRRIECFFIHPVEAVAGTNPQALLLIAEQGKYIVIGKASFVSKGFKGAEPFLFFYRAGSNLRNGNRSITYPGRHRPMHK